MEKKIAYLATPYSHDDPEVREERFRIVNEVAGDLIQKGEMVFSPISQCHPIAKAKELPMDWEYWLEFDKAFLECCCKLYVLRIDGWKESSGVQAEIKIAKELNIPIEYIDYDESNEIDEIDEIDEIETPEVEEWHETDTWEAKIFVGLKRGYEGAISDIETCKSYVQGYVNELGWGVTITPTTFVYTGGREDGAIVGIIQYPRFRTNIGILEQQTIDLAKCLKKEFKQERLSIVFPDRTIMLGEK